MKIANTNSQSSTPSSFLDLRVPNLKAAKAEEENVRTTRIMIDFLPTSDNIVGN